MRYVSFLCLLLAGCDAAKPEAKKPDQQPREAAVKPQQPQQPALTPQFVSGDPYAAHLANPAAAAQQYRGKRCKVSGEPRKIEESKSPHGWTVFLDRKNMEPPDLSAREQGVKAILSFDDPDLKHIPTDTPYPPFVQVEGTVGRWDSDRKVLHLTDCRLTEVWKWTTYPEKNVLFRRE